MKRSTSSRSRATQLGVPAVEPLCRLDATAGQGRQESAEQTRPVGDDPDPIDLNEEGAQPEAEKHRQIGAGDYVAPVMKRKEKCP